MLYTIRSNFPKDGRNRGRSSEPKSGTESAFCQCVDSNCSHKGFEAISDRRPPGIKISLTDVLMSALAMFSFKDPSLLGFDRRSRQPNHAHNLKAIYRIEKIPSDTAMIEILEPFTNF